MARVGGVIDQCEVADGFIADHVDHPNDGVDLLTTFDLDLHRSTKLQGGLAREKAGADHRRICIAGLQVASFDDGWVEKLRTGGRGNEIQVAAL